MARNRVSGAVLNEFFNEHFPDEYEIDLDSDGIAAIEADSSGYWRLPPNDLFPVPQLDSVLGLCVFDSKGNQSKTFTQLFRAWQKNHKTKTLLIDIPVDKLDEWAKILQANSWIKEID